MTAIDRYRAIVQPLSTYTWTLRRAHGMIAIAWGIAIVFSIPQLFIFGMREVYPGSGVYDCWAYFSPPWTMKLYITSFTLTIYVLPFFILLVLYGNICVHVWGNVRRMHKSTTGYNSTPVNTGNGVGGPPTSSSASPNGCINGTSYGPIRYRFTGTGVLSITHTDRKKYNGRHSLSSSSAEEVCLTMRHLAPISAKYTSGRSNPGGGSTGMEGTSGVPIITNSRSSTSRMSRSKMKTIKLTFVVTIAYLVCWAPFFTTQLWWAYDEHAPYNSK